MYVFLTVLLFVMGIVTGHMLAKVQLERRYRRPVPTHVKAKPLSRVSNVPLKKWAQTPADKNKKNP